MAAMEPTPEEAAAITTVGDVADWASIGAEDFAVLNTAIGCVRTDPLRSLGRIPDAPINAALDAAGVTWIVRSKVELMFEVTRKLLGLLPTEGQRREDAAAALALVERERAHQLDLERVKAEAATSAAAAAASAAAAAASSKVQESVDDQSKVTPLDPVKGTAGVRLDQTIYQMSDEVIPELTNGEVAELFDTYYKQEGDTLLPKKSPVLIR